MILTTVYISAIALAFFSGLLVWKKAGLTPHLLFFSLLIGCNLIVELIAVYGANFFHFRSNVPLYNYFMMPEFMAYGLYFRMISSFRLVRRSITLFMICFPFLWAYTVFWLFGPDHWNSYVIITGSVFTILIAFAYYYQVFVFPDQIIELRNSTEFWIATGLILFYASNLPYIGMLNYLVKNYLNLARAFLIVLQLLNIFMYSIFSYAYLCRIPIKKSPSF
jgi:hypothetical protein